MELVFADLHMHSLFSDGTHSPEGLVSLAKLRGLSAVALTDHDTVAGLERAERACEYYGLSFVPGVEFSCEYDGVEVHILGYFVDAESSDLGQVLSRQQMRRQRRMQEMVSRLNRDGFSVSCEEVFAKAHHGVVGRPHLAAVLLEKGYVPSLERAYKDLIGYHCPYYVPTLRMDVSEAIEVITASGGLPVLAHPIFVPSRLVGRILDSFAFWGVEVFYPEHGERFVEELLVLCKEKGLFPTGGSDFHGSAKKQDFLGKVGMPQDLFERVFADVRFR